MTQLQTMPEATFGADEGPQVVPLSSLGAITKAEIDVQITTAKTYPRSLKRFQALAREMVELDVETAASCFYVLPRGGKKLTGPSIRLAEIVASAWQNIRCGARVIGDDGRVITAQGVCHDLERNVFASVEFMRRVTGKNGRRFTDDMVVVTSNAACSIALRNAIFRVVPRAYVNPLVQIAMRVAAGDAKTLSRRRQMMLTYFKDLGVEAARVFAAVGKPGVEDVGLEELVVLQGIATAIKDGDTTVDEAFATPQAAETPPAPAGSRTEQVAEKLRKRIGNGTPKDAETGELAGPAVLEHISELLRQLEVSADEVGAFLQPYKVERIDALTAKQAAELETKLASQLEDANRRAADDNG